MGRPLKDPARDTRQKTLDAALRLFAERSFHGTSMRDIASAVGVRESALYHYFPSKDSVFQALLDDYGPARAMAKLGDSLFSGEHLEGRAFFRHFAAQLFELWTDPREHQFARVMLGEALRRGLKEENHPRHAIMRAIDGMTDLMNLLMKQNMIRKVDPRAAAFGFLGPLMQVRISMMLMADRMPPKAKLMRTVNAQVDFFWESVAPR